ncbi:conserved hypothetical protein [Formosa agariphila KMM 3901]|uniref:Universal stress protein n=1 Tax=Formosa agariphila (strain DSM 15362 / KCTC 12365 / LMG 23005 / KMM 3901 / M-2Alg 35-1) TaxID=1347342 RepID=T2KKD2_FORAG|nr:hypothetical protein [Formosa agariphila]CDF79220.1 conserved hypothetical protein [Formosa agariphila KMM 3901]
MKTVIIPTDFSESSLKLIKNAVLHYPNEEIKIVLAAGYKTLLKSYTPSNYKNSTLIQSLADSSYLTTLNSLIQEHKNKIIDVAIRLYSGDTDAAFKNFLILNDIDEALIPNSTMQQFPNKKCFDITTLISMFSPKTSRVNYQAEARKKPTGDWLFHLKQQFNF